MNADESELYFEREQSQIKHQVLAKYLERFARIVGKWSKGLIYVDAFSGPWNSVSSDLRDSSFAIALQQLRSARSTVEERYGKKLPITCIFFETNLDAFQQLDAFAKAQTDVEVIAINQPFESAVPELVRLIKSKQPGHFPFVLIDNKGWTGFAMDVIAPLVQIQPCEVLVNFMTGFIQRFIEDERDGLKASFRKLYGDDSYEQRIEGLKGRDREDAIVFAYADRLKQVGKYPFVSTALILQPTRDRTHFHLIYATRDLKGIEVFKNAERKALKLSETVRADAKRRERESVSGQKELFSGTDLPDTQHLATLQVHFENLAANALTALTKNSRDVRYDDLFATALYYPTVQELFFRRWISERGEVIGLAKKQVPKIKQGHVVTFR